MIQFLAPDHALCQSVPSIRSRWPAQSRPTAPEAIAECHTASRSPKAIMAKHRMSIALTHAFVVDLSFRRAFPRATPGLPLLLPVWVR